MFNVYLLKSLKNNWFYVGMTKNIESRISEHNSGKNKSTKNWKPFELKFVQSFKSRKEARNFEKYLKVRYNKESFLEILNQ